MTAKNIGRGSDTVWTAKDAAAATGGRAQGAWAATGVSIDTRSIKPGDLFIALKGENTDGHKYVQKALEAGACAAMVSDVSDAKQPALVGGINVMGGKLTHKAVAEAHGMKFEAPKL